MSQIDCFWVDGPQGAEIAKSVYGNLDPSKVRDGDEYLFAKCGDNVIGACRLSPEEAGFSLRSMEVKPDHARKGVGRAMLKAFEARLSEREIESVHCIAYEHLKDFYASIGLAEISEAQAPEFIRDRVAGYRERNPEKSFVVLARCIRPVQ